MGNMVDFSGEQMLKIFYSFVTVWPKSTKKHSMTRLHKCIFCANFK